MPSCLTCSPHLVKQSSSTAAHTEFLDLHICLRGQLQKLLSTWRAFVLPHSASTYRECSRPVANSFSNWLIFPQPLKRFLIKGIVGFNSPCKWHYVLWFTHLVTTPLIIIKISYHTVFLFFYILNWYTTMFWHLKKKFWLRGNYRSSWPILWDSLGPRWEHTSDMQTKQFRAIPPLQAYTLQQANSLGPNSPGPGKKGHPLCPKTQANYLN